MGIPLRAERYLVFPTSLIVYCAGVCPVAAEGRCAFVMMLVSRLSIGGVARGVAVCVDMVCVDVVCVGVVCVDVVCVAPLALAND